MHGMTTDLTLALRAIYEPFHANEWVPLAEELATRRDSSKTQILSCPLYLADVGYGSATGTRWMIVGQQTHSWHNELAEQTGGIAQVTVAELQQRYAEFNLGKWYKPTPFWGFARQVNEWLGNPPGCFLWSNLERVDFDRDRYTNEDETETRRMFGRLLLQEIQLLKPELVLFAVGSSYTVSDYLPSREVISHTRYLDEFRLPELPEAVCFKTYHPGHLMRNNEAFQAVVEGFQKSRFST